MPTTAGEWTKLGNSFLANKNYNEAIKSGEHALQIDILHAPAWKLLAKTYKIAGEIADSVNILRKAVKKIPGDAELWNNLGAVLQEMGELADAIDAYEMALALDPTDGIAWYNAGLVYGKINLLGNALYCFERAGQLGDHDGQEKVEMLRQRSVKTEEPPFTTRAGQKRRPPLQIDGQSPSPRYIAENPASAPVTPVERVIIKEKIIEIVKVKCPFCGILVDHLASTCPHCAGILK